MDPIPGIKETFAASMYRVKGVAVYLKYFQDLLCRLAAHDETMPGFIDDMIKDCDKLEGSLRTLLEKVNELSDRGQQSDSERRHLTRFGAEGEVTLIFNRDVSKSFFIKDISANGVGIIGSQPMDMVGSMDVVVASPFLRSSYHRNARLAWQKKLGNNLWEGGICLSPSN